MQIVTTSTTTTQELSVIDHQISLENNVFEPQYLTITKGETVEWINLDNEEHTIIGFGLDIDLRPGGRYTYTFDTVGRFNYSIANCPDTQGFVIVD
jgi:plastocyanin